MNAGLVQLFTVIAAFLAFLSALFWIQAARIKTPLPIGYLSGPPQEVVDRVEAQSRWNSRAAFFAGLAALSQSAALILAA